MSNIKEIKYCYNILKKKKLQIIIMHCNTEYPTPVEDINLRVILELKKIFKCDIGFSDHSTSIMLMQLPYFLVLVMLKNILLLIDMKRPDHKGSLDQSNFLKW